MRADRRRGPLTTPGSGSTLKTPLQSGVAMNSRIALFAFAVVLGAAQYAAAQEHPFVVYQNSLLARSLPAKDKELCDRLAGKNANAPRYSACHVTRLFLSDIKVNRDTGYPKLTDIDFADDAEMQLLSDRMAKYGG